MEDFNMKILLAVLMTFIPVLMISCGKNNMTPAGSGLIESTEVVVSTEIPGQLKTLYFQEGDQIIRGDTIGIIDTITVSLHLRQAGAAKQAAQTQLEIASVNREQALSDYNLARKEFDRMASLIESGSVNQQQYDKAEHAYNQSVLGKKRAEATCNAVRAELVKIDAEIDLLRKQLDDCMPTAPISGRIIDRYLDVGELSGIGKPLIKIARLDTVWVKIYLPPANLTGITLGDTAEVDPEDGREMPMRGFVSWISSDAEFTPKNVQTREARADLVYAVKITIPNPGERLKIGMPVSVTIP